MTAITDAEWDTFKAVFTAAIQEVGNDVAVIDPGGFRLTDPYGLHPRAVYRAFQLGCRAAGVAMPHTTFESWAASSYSHCDLAPRWFALYGIEVPS